MMNLNDTLKGIVTHYDPKTGFGKIQGEDNLTYTFNKKTDKLKIKDNVTFTVSNMFQYSRVAIKINLVEKPTETKE